MTSPRLWVALAAAFGFTGVAAGAFGAHAIVDPQAKAWVETAAKYQLAHTMAIFASLSIQNWGGRIARFAPWFFAFGIVVFAASLYAMALGAPRILGAVTPIGGLAFLIGWAILFAAGLSLKPKGQTL